MRSAGTAWVLYPKKGISTVPFTDWDLLGLASDSGQVEAGQLSLLSMAKEQAALVPVVERLALQLCWVALVSAP